MSKPYHLNAPGDFYREDGCCLICDVAVERAPDLLAFDEDDYYGGCYVKRQPRSQTEVEQMIRAMKVTEVDCFRYRGSDPAVLSRLNAERMQAQCDGEDQARASHELSDIYAAAREKRGEAKIVSTRTSFDRKAKLIIRSFEDGQIDFQIFRNDWGATNGRYIPLQVSGFFSSEKEAQAAAKKSKYWKVCR